MATYTQLSDDEKAQIKIAAKRNLEYQMSYLYRDWETDRKSTR